MLHFFLLFPLETAGIILGWGGIIFFSFLSVYVVLSLCFVLFYSTDVYKIEDKDFKMYMLCLYLVVIILTLWVSKRLIDGIKKRKSEPILLWLFFIVIHELFLIIFTNSLQLFRIPTLIILLFRNITSILINLITTTINWLIICLQSLIHQCACEH